MAYGGGSSQPRGQTGAGAAGLHHSSRQRQILNPLSEARDWTCVLMDPSQIHFCCATTGTPDKTDFKTKTMKKDKEGIPTLAQWAPPCLWSTRTQVWSLAYVAQWVKGSSIAAAAAHVTSVAWDMIPGLRTPYAAGWPKMEKKKKKKKKARKERKTKKDTVSWYKDKGIPVRRGHHTHEHRCTRHRNSGYVNKPSQTWGGKWREHSTSGTRQHPTDINGRTFQAEDQ